MNIEYANNRLRKQLSNASEIKKAFGERAKMVSRRLDQISAAPNLAVLMQLPGAACHALTGNREGEWAVSISGNHRLIFVLDHHPVPKKQDKSIDTIKVTDIIITKADDYH